MEVTERQADLYLADRVLGLGAHLAGAQQALFGQIPFSAPVAQDADVQTVGRDESVVADLLVETRSLLEATSGFAPLTEILVYQTEIVEAARQSFRRID